MCVDLVGIFVLDTSFGYAWIRFFWRRVLDTFGYGRFWIRLDTIFGYGPKYRYYLWIRARVFFWIRLDTFGYELRPL